MLPVQVTSDWSYRGLSTIILENRLLRVVFLPELGGKIWQITYKPQDTNLLWNNPRIFPARLPMNSRYDDVWCGGWDELFPNDEVATIAGESYPDHGELWTGSWQARPFEKPGEVGVELSFITPISSIKIEKTVTLRADQSLIRFQHKFTNLGVAPFPFLWKLHPAFAVSPDHRVDFPSMQVVLEPVFSGTLTGVSSPFAWPTAQLNEKQIDLRRIPGVDQPRLYFFYGTEMKDSWCALTNTKTGLSCGLYFDPKVFNSAWLFASYGGWRNYQVAVLEPCTGYPLNFEAMRAAGRARTLAPQTSFTTEVLFSVQENIAAVGKINSDGAISAP
jgi:galactose mutarotase-like enzyme